MTGIQELQSQKTAATLQKHARMQEQKTPTNQKITEDLHYA